MHPLLTPLHALFFFPSTGVEKRSRDKIGCAEAGRKKKKDGGEGVTSCPFHIPSSMQQGGQLLANAACACLRARVVVTGGVGSVAMAASEERRRCLRPLVSRLSRPCFCLYGITAVPQLNTTLSHIRKTHTHTHTRFHTCAGSSLHPSLGASISHE